jgi:hypothetical protein
MSAWFGLRRARGAASGVPIRSAPSPAPPSLRPLACGQPAAAAGRLLSARAVRARRAAAAPPRWRSSSRPRSWSRSTAPAARAGGVCLARLLERAAPARREPRARDLPHRLPLELRPPRRPRAAARHQMVLAEMAGPDNHWKISVVQSPPWRRTSWARAGPSGRAWKSTKKSLSTSIPPSGWQFTFRSQERSSG